MDLAELDALIERVNRSETGLRMLASIDLGRAMEHLAIAVSLAQQPVPSAAPGHHGTGEG